MKSIRRALLALILVTGAAACNSSITSPIDQHTPDPGFYTPDPGFYTPDPGFRHTPDPGF